MSSVRLLLAEKIFFFTSSHEAAHRAAMVYSLLATCKLHGIHPYYWIRDVIGNMHRYTTENIEGLLPQNWKVFQKVQNVT